MLCPNARINDVVFKRSCLAQMGGSACHGVSASAQAAVPSGQHPLLVQQRNRRRSKRSWFEVLDHASLRDREFSVAHKKEAELKLALEMSLNDGIGEEGQTAEILNDMSAQDLNARASCSGGDDVA